MYGKGFSKVYNEFGWNYYAETFGEQLGIWLRDHNVSPRRALDIGCGTGVLCRIIKDLGIEVSGIDLSENMIEIAERENPRIPFMVGDMTEYVPEQMCDLVTCTGDALNHLDKLQLVEKMFRNVYSYMTPGGVFIFDILNGREGRSDEPFELDYSDTVKAVLRITKEGHIITLHVAVYENNVLQFEETVTETFYEPEEVISLLEACGFESITCGDALNPGSDRHGTTLFLTAIKPARLR